MNDLVRFANSVEYTNGKKRGRPPKFNANQFYPFKAERRLQGALKKELATFIREAYEVAIVGETFTADSLEDLSEMPERLSEGFKQEVNYAANSIAKNAYDNIANMTEMVVGKPYYPPAAKDELLKNWEANFNLLCKSAESDAKKDISRIVAQAENEGWGMKRLERAVMGELPSKYASRAKLIARTESAKLNSEVTLESFRETGCEYYTWMAAMDERTRPEHAMMHGLICSVNDPTVWYEENPDDPMHPIEHRRDDTMVHLHPGEDFQCRCTMVMWDPEIDGKYEIKEGEKPEEPEEEPEKEPESPELEKANEAVAEKEKELETTKAELKSANEELSGEKAAREAAEKKISEREAEKDILQRALERHNARTQVQAEEIRERWRQRGVKMDLKSKGHPKEYIDNVLEIEKKTGVRYTGEMNHEAADTGKVNPNYASSVSFKSNCQSCVIVYELRRRGFNMEALARSYGNLQDVVAKDSRSAWKDVSGKRAEFQNGRSEKFVGMEKFGVNEKMADLESATQEDGRYFISLAWKKSWGGAHVVMAERKNGFLSFYDPQDNLAYSVKEFRDKIVKNTWKDCTFGILRVDNMLLDTSLNIKELETTASTLVQNSN